MKAELIFYLSVFMRRIHYFLLVAIVFTAAGVATAIVLPTRYTADAVLLVESPQIPDELAASTVNTNRGEQLQIIEQRLLTRANLLDIATENQVYADRAQVFADEIVKRMREDTSLRIRTGRDKASLFTINFEADRPITAEAVVNAYVTQVLEDNIRLRTDRAEGTMEFFEQEVERLGTDLARKGAEILDFKNRNLDSLPENLNYQLSRLDELRDRTTSAERELASLASQRERLILIYNATGGTNQAGGDLRTQEQRDLDAAETQLSQLLTVYSEQNPRVVSLRARIELLREAAETAQIDETEDQSQDTTLLDLQLSEIDDRQELLAEEVETMEAEAEVLRANVEAVPGNSVTLDALERDYANLQSQYNQAVSAASTAATGERIELLSKGERITVLSQPTVPGEPSSPNRPMIAAMGAAMGVAGGVALVVLLELLNGSIRRPIDITRALGITPITTLPMMRTPREIAMRRGLVVSVILVGCAITVSAIFYTHTQIMPVDLIAVRVLNRFGI
ncbi:MAG: Wzz/FepE/Etk N-terminal domain-containing protein [Pseudomonadota bacterium]